MAVVLNIYAVLNNINNSNIIIVYTFECWHFLAINLVIPKVMVVRSGVTSKFNHNSLICGHQDMGIHQPSSVTQKMCMSRGDSGYCFRFTINPSSLERQDIARAVKKCGLLRIF